MLKNLTYKQKIRLTGFLTLLACFLCYKLAISKTLDEYHASKEHDQLGETTTGVHSLQSLLQKEESVNTFFRQYTLDTLAPEKNLLSLVSNYCRDNNIQLKEYRPLPLTAIDSISILTRLVSIEGPFLPCLKFIYLLEKARKVGKIDAAEFASATDPKDKTVRLTCTIYIQNLIPSDHEN